MIRANILPGGPMLSKKNSINQSDNSILSNAGWTGLPPSKILDPFIDPLSTLYLSRTPTPYLSRIAIPYLPRIAIPYLPRIDPLPVPY